MNSLDTQYTKILHDIYYNGSWEDNRTGIRAKTIPFATVIHNMNEGFPMLTIKRVPFKSMSVELEGFINGITSKKWFQERGCTIWDEWCNPQKVPYANDEKTKAKMLAQDDLGKIYGAMWRDYHVPDACYFNGYDTYGKSRDSYVRSRGIDQFKRIVDTLKTNPQDRRMICLAWNPLAINYQALPPCHTQFQVSVIDKKLNLSWYQRSVDAPLGLAYNIASYGLLLHLLAKESGFEEGTLAGFLNNVHIYENQQDGVVEILSRNSNYDLPKVETNFSTIFAWTHKDSKLINYQSLPTVKMPVAV